MEALIRAVADGKVGICDVFECTERSADRNSTTGLLFGEFRIEIRVLTKLIGVLFVVTLSH